MSTDRAFLRPPVQRVGIIGGGVAGLVTAKTLREAGLECEIFERGERVGGVWTVGYRGFGLQTPRGLYDFPDWPMPDWYPELPSGAQIQQHLEGYARHFGLEEHIHFGVEVTGIAPRQGGRGWTLLLRQRRGGETQRDFDFVVFATGLYSNPNVPAFPGREGFGGTVLHSSEYRDAEQVRDREVIVVGYGKSALDIAVDASRHARSTTLLFRDSHWPVPVKMLGLIDTRKLLMNRLAGAFLPLYQRPSPWQIRLHRSAPWLVHGFWRAVEALVRAQFRLGACGVVPTAPMEQDLFTGGILPTNDTFPRMRRGAIQPRRGSIERYTASGVRLDDGAELNADIVIHGTGWRCDYSMLPEPLQRAVEDDGLYLYRHILHPDVPNLAFIGWASTYSNSLTSHLGAVWLRHLLTGRMELPGRDDMMREIHAMRRWKRSFMPALACRASMLQLHMWHFHDDLLRDMGMAPRRKRHALAELLADYGPADYAEILTGGSLGARRRRPQARQDPGHVRGGAEPPAKLA